MPNISMTRHALAFLFLIAATLGCGGGTVRSPAELGENEHALTCAPTPAPSPFEHRDPIQPPDPMFCRPPEMNPGGVNGTRSERPVESESRLAR